MNSIRTKGTARFAVLAMVVATATMAMGQTPSPTPWLPNTPNPPDATYNAGPFGFDKPQPIDVIWYPYTYLDGVHESYARVASKGTRTIVSAQGYIGSGIHQGRTKIMVRQKDSQIPWIQVNSEDSGQGSHFNYAEDDAGGRHDIFYNHGDTSEEIWMVVYESTANVWIPGPDGQAAIKGSDPDILCVRSTNGGTVWSAPIAIAADFSSDNLRDTAPRLTSARVGNVNVWVATWQKCFDAHKIVQAAYSTDNGATWSQPIVGGTATNTLCADPWPEPNCRWPDAPVNHITSDRPCIDANGARNEFVVAWHRFFFSASCPAEARDAVAFSVGSYSGSPLALRFSQPPSTAYESTTQSGGAWPLSGSGSLDICSDRLAAGRWMLGWSQHEPGAVLQDLDIRAKACSGGAAQLSGGTIYAVNANGSADPGIDDRSPAIARSAVGTENETWVVAWQADRLAYPSNDPNWTLQPPDDSLGDQPDNDLVIVKAQGLPGNALSFPYANLYVLNSNYGLDRASGSNGLFCHNNPDLCNQPAGASGAANFIAAWHTSMFTYYGSTASADLGVFRSVSLNP